MLLIRKEQMDAFQQQAERNFVDSVVNSLRTNHTETVKDISEDKLHKRVEYGVRRAREYGLSWKKNLRAFTTLMFKIAPGFDRYPAFKKLLTDTKLPPNHRMGDLLKKITVADCDDVQKHSNLSIWPEDLR